MLKHSATALFLSSTLICASLGNPATAASAPAAATQTPVKAQLESRYTQLKAAMESRSPARIKALLAPGFASTQLSGKTIDADAMIAELAHVPTDPNRATTTTIDSIAVTGNLARVQQTMTASARITAKSGASHLMKLIAVSEDTWQHTPDGWLLKTTTSKDMTVTQDGKVIRHAHIGDPAVRAAGASRQQGR